MPARPSLLQMMPGNKITRAFVVVAAIFGGCALLFLLAPARPLRADDVPRITAKAVWNPTSTELSEVRRKCTEGDPAQHETCLLDSMKAAGASQEAQDFVKAFPPGSGLAYLRGFRDTGRVDIAYIEYLFRANELDGVLLVNGTPPMIDVDDNKLLSQEDLRKNADYAALLQKYPHVSIFPGDRFHMDSPVASFSTDSGPDFAVEYRLQDGCHACERIGTLVVSFMFDASGRFVEMRVLKVRPGGDADYDSPELTRRPEEGTPAKEGKIDATEIHAKLGVSFTIVLAANHTTGYSWRLVKPLNPELVRRVSDVYNAETSGKMGAGGKELWTFETLHAGTVEIDFEYARPFEKNAAPADTAKYRVVIK